MAADTTEMENQLEKLLLEDANFAELEREFDQYCPFEALGMVRSEVRHGNYLSYLLSPGRPHGFNTQVLRAFLMCITQKCVSLQSEFSLKALDVHLMDIDQADVRREWRNIDLLIVLRSSKIVIPIELKIDSSQGHDQLERYRRITEQEWPRSQGWKHINIFLTKHEEVPIDVDHWEPLRIGDLVEHLQILANQPNDSPAAEMLRSYLRMLRRHHLEDRRLEEIARKLWAQHSEALEFLADRRPDATGNLFEALKDRRMEFIKTLKELDVEMVLDADYKTIIRLAFESWDALPGFKNSQWTDSKRFILLELKREGPRINAYLYLGPGDEGIRQRYVTILEKNRLHRPTSRVGKDWMCLAKKEIYSEQLDDETEMEASIEVIIKSVSLFARRVFDHFNPVLEKLTAPRLTPAPAGLPTK
ncbi:PD-(D/E)XK nuclease family protein [Mycoplana dimorpha]|uniref:PD-(D/E)XK nuclease superfamily protein n=1 Tax=Mycoplana dimorpha TaxID=28320 RepID=A0A2T5BB10_MYCDI|nr:PD-(D/E)XK nuclease family protein [Mycoplana dimorpha]PTM96113.1 PD-(D/E)XK nuclease superfamily protein [Mycoplana dimorpha]